MGEGRSSADHANRLRNLTNVFTDTCILLNYVQKGVEPDRSSVLIENDQIDIVVGVTVAEEIETVDERRTDIYEDFVDYLLEEAGELGEYDPSDRRPYFGENDIEHVRNLQMHLSQLDNRAEIQRQLRRFIRSVRRRIRYLREHVIPEALFDQQPGLSVIFALNSVISNDKDRNVVGDAALWAAEGRESSGVFLTMDNDHLLRYNDEINEALRNSKNESWELLIKEPNDLLEENTTGISSGIDSTGKESSSH